MKRLIKKALGLFRKPKEEVDPKEVESWPFPVEFTPEKKPVKKKRVSVPKATTRKKPVVKKATTVVKKTTKAKKK